MAGKTYYVMPGKILSHSRDKKDYREGEPVDLSHLSDGDIARLVSIGLVTDKKEKEVVKDGKTNTDKTDGSG